MVLELHVWGPSFGLPSIDPHCLATIALCQENLPSGSWVLIPSSHALTPLGDLPALKHGAHWISGFRNISICLDDISSGVRTADGHLNASQLADCTALLSFIESRGLPLLDLLLYVSSENYNACTRPALGQVLSWPDSWILPGRIRGRAKKRSEHLGLSSLDVDTAEDNKSRGEGLTAQIPVSLRKPKQTVSSLLGRDMKNKFRLDAVSSNFLEPLQEMLEDKQYLLGETPSSADYFAVAVLSLMYFPSNLAHSWSKTIIENKCPSLAAWTRRCASTWFEVASPTSTDSQDSPLPWLPSPPRSWPEIVNITVNRVAEVMPIIGPTLVTKQIETSVQSSHTTRQHQKQEALKRISQQHLVSSQLVASALSLSTLVGILLWKGILIMPRRSPGPRVRSFGEAGGILGIS